MDQETLTRLFDITRQMAEERTLLPLLDFALEQAAGLVGAESGYIVLIAPEGTITAPIRYAGRNADQFSTSIVNQVLMSNGPVLLRDALNDPAYLTAKSVSALRLRSVVCVPLPGRERTRGAIYMENRTLSNQFDERALNLLALFARHAATAIENAYLNQQLEDLVRERTKALERTKDAVEESWHQAVEANHIRTVLLSNIVHDLRAPLSIVEGVFEILETEGCCPPDSETAEWIRRGIEASNRAIRLTDDIFDLTTLEQGGLRIIKAPISLLHFLDSVYEVAQGMPHSHLVELRANLSSELPTLEFDPDRIQQVIFNLLSNAFKFTEQGEVTLYAHHTDGDREVCIGVQDTGVGIPPERLETLFTRFGTFSDANNLRRHGTGLGLAISRELVERHGGRIWATSTLGEGSDFCFTLPIEPD